MDYKTECEHKIKDAIYIFADSFCKHCKDGCCEKEDCPLQLLLDGKVNLYGNSVFNAEDDLCVFDDDYKVKSKKYIDEILNL